jgi:hypothetical protein
MRLAAPTVFIKWVFTPLRGHRGIDQEVSVRETQSESGIRNHAYNLDSDSNLVCSSFRSI